MKHFGDITKLNGAELPIVDIITGGSPCQDLSVAGKRAGLAGERSGLFMEQIRIIKEMREHDRLEQIRSGRTDVDIRPRYMVWENVPGAFSSNKGEDFRAVLEETAKVVCEDATIPGPPGGRWTPSGCIMGNGWSIAWRVHDAQFWGVPQRRKRIALVADFGGVTAPEILFERESVSGNLEQSGAEGETVAGDAPGCTSEASYTLKIRGGVEIDSQGKKAGKGALVQTELSGTLGVSQDQTLITKAVEPIAIRLDNGSANPCTGQVTPTIRQGAGPNGTSNVGIACDATGINGQVAETVVYCLQGNGIDRADTAGCNGKGWRENESYTLNTIDRPAVAFSFDSLASNSMKSSNPNSGCRETEVSKTIDCADPNPSKNQGGGGNSAGISGMCHQPSNR